MPALARAHPRGSGRSDARLGGEGNADRMEHPPEHHVRLLGTMPRQVSWLAGWCFDPPSQADMPQANMPSGFSEEAARLQSRGRPRFRSLTGTPHRVPSYHPAAHSIGWNQGPSVIGFCFGDCQPGTGSSGQPGPGGGGRDAVREARPGTGSRGAVRPVQRPVRGRFGAGSAPALSACSITLRMTLGRASSPRVSSATQRPASRPTVPASSRQAAQTSSSR